MIENLTNEQQRLPQVEKIVTEMVEGEEVEKQLYVDGSYGIRSQNKIERYFADGKRQVYEKSGNVIILSQEILPDGTRYEWFKNGQICRVDFSDGAFRSYYRNGQLQEVLYSDGSYCRWNKNGQVEQEVVPDEWCGPAGLFAISVSHLECCDPVTVKEENANVSGICDDPIAYLHVLDKRKDAELVDNGNFKVYAAKVPSFGKVYVYNEDAYGELNGGYFTIEDIKKWSVSPEQEKIINEKIKSDIQESIYAMKYLHVLMNRPDFEINNLTNTLGYYDYKYCGVFEMLSHFIDDIKNVKVSSKEERAINEEIELTRKNNDEFNASCYYHDDIYPDDPLNASVAYHNDSKNSCLAALNKKYTVQNKKTEGENSLYSLHDENGKRYEVVINYGRELNSERQGDNNDMQSGIIEKPLKTVSVSVEKVNADGNCDYYFKVYSAVEETVFATRPNVLIERLKSNAKNTVGQLNGNKLVAVLRAIDRYNQDQLKIVRSTTQSKGL